jgi:hypothetical protein
VQQLNVCLVLLVWHSESQTASDLFTYAANSIWKYTRCEHVDQMGG